LHKKYKILISLFLTLLLFLAFAPPLNPIAGGWTQQFMPFLNNRPISDITFTDSLTGFAITGDNTVGDTNYIVKTTNGGDNWSIVFTVYRDLSSVIFLNNDTGFVSGGFNVVGGYLIRTTNGGINWNTIPNSSFANHFDDMAVLTQNIIWVVDDNSFNGGIYITTNGGNSWSLQQSFSSANPNKIYMYNRNIGFACDNFRLYKTTNGENWNLDSGSDGFTDIYFIDTLNGWKANGNMKRTTNGGLKYLNQPRTNAGKC
jgi:hypothetical protein